MQFFRNAASFLLLIPLVAMSTSPAIAQDKPNAFADDNEFGAVNSQKSQRPASPLGKRGGTEVVPAQPAALPEDDGISYTYVRACTAGAGSDLDPATCPRMDAQCDAQDDGILVNWIELDSTVQPTTRTPTGRSSCMYPGELPAPPIDGVEAPEEAPIVITLEEFQKQPVLAATIVSQPSNFGLRNAHSNVYAQAREQEFTFEFQDAQIVLKAPGVLPVELRRRHECHDDHPGRPGGRCRLRHRDADEPPVYPDR